MKRIAIIFALALVCLTAAAQIPDGWQYKDGSASITAVKFIDDYDHPTILHMVVGKKNGQNTVFFGLGGNHKIHDFRESQLYVSVSFDYRKAERWRVKLHETETEKFRYFFIVSADKFIARLKKAKTIDVSMPLYEVGVTDFSFYALDYPLDW